MASIESRIATVEARVSPEGQQPQILYAVEETASEFEKETIRERAIAEYEAKHGVEVDPYKARFICLEICYTSVDPSATL